MRTLLILLLLSGCSPYWVKTGPSMEVADVQYVDHVENWSGRKGDWGWFQPNAATGKATIVVDKNLSKSEQDCVLAHELKHAQGYDHDHDWHQHKLDCGT